LAEDGISAEVLDLRSLVPLDEAAVLASVSKTKRAVIVHEAVTKLGFGAELSAMLNEELFGQLAAPVLRVGGANTPIPYASNLEKAFMPDPSKIVDAAKRTMK
jgi:acetoin:2,6-dichlorophenolindophenol oxidoreductase subunit beta